MFLTDRLVQFITLSLLILGLFMVTIYTLFTKIKKNLLLLCVGKNALPLQPFRK
jgi:hypothetical protein